ncbi:MAG: PLP-dependent aminotransferase family protein, partial [Burkholderiaceae bacterium]
RALASDLNLSRNTVMGAFARLIAEGLLEAREPAGTFVSRRVPSDGPPGVLPASPVVCEATLQRRLARLQFRGEPHLVVNPHEHLLTHDFWVGRPDSRLFPMRLWHSLLTRLLRGSSRHLCGYGDPQGLLALREAIASHIGATRGIATDPSRILITNGIQEGLNLLAQLLIAPGVDVAVESPCYLGASNVFAHHGAILHPVPVDDAGLDPALLPASAALVYVTPSHQYPLGSTLSLARREALLAWANACGGYVAEDDYDSDFFYDGTPLPALKSLDRHDQVVYLGTFSKSLGAGLRIGYMVLPAELCAPARHAKALLNNCQPWLEQAALAAFMAEGGYAEHLRRLRQLYAVRRNHLRAALTHRLPSWRVRGSDGGMHLVVHLPDPGPDAEAMERVARSHGVGVYSIPSGNAQLFDANESMRRVLLFGYASLNETEISDALLRLRDVAGIALEPSLPRGHHGLARWRGPGSAGARL